MKRTKNKKNQWEDHYTRQAKKDKYPARSVYKLQEIQKKHRLIKKGDRILDLGCAPGSWLMYAAELAGKEGQVTGIDLNPVTVTLNPPAKALVGDIFSMEEEFAEELADSFNVVISDMAPKTTGNKHVDAARSDALCQQALYVAEKRLATGGSFVCKIFQGPDFKEFVDSVKRIFKICHIFKPQSSRKQSKEIFIIGQGKK